MAVSNVQIANMALSLLGDEAILSLTEDTNRARVMNLWFEIARDTVLQKHLWNEASARQQLSLDAAVPAFGFARQFQLPSDFLRAVQLNDGKEPFRIEGKKLLSDTSVAKLRYIKKVTDPNEFGPMLVQAIAAYLAWVTAIQITGSASLAEQMKQDYEDTLQAARGVDAQQGPVEVLEADTWTDARIAFEDEIFRPIESP